MLELLRSGGTRRVADLARELGTTPELVGVMLEDLCRMGYLRRVEGACGESCGSCSVAGLCAAGSPSTSPSAPLRARPGAGGGQLWALTEKATGMTESA